MDDDNPAFDASVSHHARIYNYLLGGKDHFAADRAYADALLSVYPGAAAAARANRSFLGRAVRFLAGEAGVSQFLDIGTGIPGPGSTHELAQEARPESRVVYVDNDPVVLSHARAFLTGREPGTTDYIDADLRHPEQILGKAARTLDLTRPVGLLLLAILHAIGDADDPHRIVATLVDALPSGSYLAIAHWGTDPDRPGAVAKVGDISRELSHHQYTARTEEQIARFFDGLDLVEPGLVRVEDWRPGPGDETDVDLVQLAGIARKP
ncbi:MAG: SAM-dependent methyltransferase [Nocardiopsaceae bacterium]|nr:SAM-dependent methyltransferase [Nocardiopsaceae bacterium]